MNQRQKTIRHSRPRPYDLRRRVLLKNFLREQMSYMPQVKIEVSNRSESDTSYLENDQSVENSDSVDNTSVENDENQENKIVCNTVSVENIDHNVEAVDENVKQQNMPLSEITTCLIIGEKTYETNTSFGCKLLPEILESSVKNGDNHVLSDVSDQENITVTKKLKRKFSMRMPYSFSRRKNLRDSSKPEMGISKSKNLLVSPKKKKRSGKMILRNIFFTDPKLNKESKKSKTVSDKNKKECSSSNSFVMRLFKNNETSSQDMQVANCSKSSGDQCLDNQFNETVVKSKEQSSQRSVSVQTDKSLDDECKSKEFLLEENRRLLKSLNYLVKVNQSNYWLRSSGNEKEKTELNSSCSDENSDYGFLETKPSNCVCTSASVFCSVCEKQFRTKVFKTRLARSVTIQEGDIGIEKRVKCRRVKSDCKPSSYDLQKSSNLARSQAFSLPADKSINHRHRLVSYQEPVCVSEKRVTRRAFLRCNSLSSNKVVDSAVNGGSCRRTKSVHVYSDRILRFNNMPSYKFS